MKPNMIKQIEENVRIRVTKGIVNRLLETIIYVLYNKWDWGYVRLDRLTDEVNEVYDAIEKGYVNFEDIKEANRQIPRPERMINNGL